MGRILELAKRDIKKISSNLNGWAVEVSLTTPDDSKTITFAGIHVKIGLGINTDGNMVTSKKAPLSFHEDYLTEQSYPVRNASGEVSLMKHKVSVKDSTGVVKNYVIDQCFPDEALGLLSCILGDLKV